MINKILKNFFDLIAIKNDNFIKTVIKFIFFLRYLILIFVISILTYFITPIFINYEEKIRLIEKNLIKNYNIDLLKYENVEYKIFPSPRLHFNNSSIKINDTIFENDIKKLSIILDVKKLYNYENINIQNIKLINSEIKIKDLKKFFSYFYTLKNVIFFENSIVQFIEGKNTIVDLKINKFSNKNTDLLKLAGQLFDKNVIITFSKNRKLNFKFNNVGVNISVFFNQDSTLNNLSGTIRAMILNTNLNFDFDIDNEIKIFKSNLRNKNIKTSFNGIIKYKPFFNYNLNINLARLKSQKILNENILGRLTKYSSYFKKLNGKIKVKYESKSYFNNFIKSIFFDLKTENGEVNIDNGIIEFENGKFFFNGNKLDLINQNKFIFDLVLESSNSKKLLKKLKISKKIKQKKLFLKIKGYLNLNSNKVHFSSIDLNNNYKANMEDLNYYENVFNATILKNKNIFKALDIQNLRSFLLEIN